MNAKVVQIDEAFIVDFLGLHLNGNYFWGMISIMIFEPYQLTAHEASNLISSGSLTSVELVNSCLNQLSKTEN